MNRLLILLIIGILSSCNSKNDGEKSLEKEDIKEVIKGSEQLLDRVLKTKLFDGVSLKNEFELDERLIPLFLEADFNSDGTIDIAIPIIEKKTDKVGFAIIHGVSNEVYIIGAGVEVKNGLSDDMSYIDLWKVNREKINKEELIINSTSLQIEKTEAGGGQIYWNGTEYVYFHQSC